MFDPSETKRRLASQLVGHPRRAEGITRTERSPPGVAATHISPCCLGPVGPVFRHAPVGDLTDRHLFGGEWLLFPPIGVLDRREPCRTPAT